MIRINLTSVPVADQARALDFYVDILGFQLKHDIDLGGPRWLTVVSPADPDGTELLLEPVGGVAEAPVYQKALRDKGIPWTAFAVDDIEAEYARLLALGVVFTGPPAKAGPTIVARLDDTVGNWIQLVQHTG